MALTLRLFQQHVTPNARLELARAASARPFAGDSIASVVVNDEQGVRVQHMHPGDVVTAGNERFILQAVNTDDPDGPSCSFCAWA